LVNFFRNDLAPEDGGADRDLGLALLHLARQPGPPRSDLLSLAHPLLEKAVQADPDDVEALEAHGLALALSGQEAEALQAWQQVLKKVPEREVSLGLAAQALKRQGKRREAAAYLHRLVAVNPANAGPRVDLAQLLGEQGEWEAARQQCETALRLNPFSPEARQQFVLCWLRSGDRGRAEAELARLLRLRPERKRQLEAWFAEQVRGGGP
jgi:tetratricopeptide (TPR) repeat protein